MMKKRNKGSISRETFDDFLAERGTGWRSR